MTSETGFKKTSLESKKSTFGNDVTNLPRKTIDFEDDSTETLVAKPKEELLEVSLV